MTSKRKVTVSNEQELKQPLVGGEDNTPLSEEQADTLQMIDQIEEEREVEDLPDDEEIWDGGPTAGLIKIWKAKHGEVYLCADQ